MENKRKRLQLVSEILKSNVVSTQEGLLELLKKQKCLITQATLSRDLRQLKVAKTPLPNGIYKYVLPPVNQPIEKDNTANNFSNGAILSVEFSGNLAVIKTKPGYANAIAWDIDNEAKHEVLGTIAGDDTVLIISREGVPRKEITEILNVTLHE